MIKDNDLVKPSFICLLAVEPAVISTHLDGYLHDYLFVEIILCLRNFKFCDDCDYLLIESS